MGADENAVIKRRPRGLRALRNELEDILKGQYPDALYALDRFPYKGLIAPLRSLFLSKDESLRWRSITAFGYVTARIEEQDTEMARIIMRQLMWSLNDESGGIGWGSPEAMGESLARSPRLLEEYGRILLSYILEGKNYLEYHALREGAIWGVTRTCFANPKVMKSFDAVDCLIPYVRNENFVQIGLALLALSALGESELVSGIVKEGGLEGKELRVYWDWDFKVITFSSQKTLASLLSLR